MLGKNGNITTLAIKHKDLCSNVHRIIHCDVMMLMGDKFMAKINKSLKIYDDRLHVFENLSCVGRNELRNKADQENFASLQNL